MKYLDLVALVLILKCEFWLNYQSAVPDALQGSFNDQLLSKSTSKIYLCASTFYYEVFVSCFYKFE